MLLHEILALQGSDVPLQIFQDQVLKMRLVSNGIKLILERNPSINVKIRISKAGEQGLNANFLSRWAGMLHLSCKMIWNPDSPWYREFTTSIAARRLRPPHTLALYVEGRRIHLLPESLAMILPTIEHLRITFRGNCEDISACSEKLATMARNVTLDITVDMGDSGGTQASALLQTLRALKIRLSSLAVRLCSTPRTKCFNKHKPYGPAAMFAREKHDEKKATSNVPSVRCSSRLAAKAEPTGGRRV
jgi:hypothetical protein